MNITSLNMSTNRVLAAAALTLAAILASGARAESPAPAPDVLAALAAPQALPDVIEGRPDAPAIIIEYASLTCSHCAAFHRDVWPKVKAKYVDTGKAKFILREFPLDPLATGAFMLARCAAGKRDAVIDRLFDHQAEWAFTDQPLVHLKEQLLAAGMSDAGFAACLKDQALLDKVKAMHEAAASKLGVRSTPTFFIDGVRLNGENGLDKFDQILTARKP